MVYEFGEGDTIQPIAEFKQLLESTYLSSNAKSTDSDGLLHISPWLFYM